MSRDLPPLNALRTFEVAARLQSVSLAAIQLHVTHGAVSRQIRVLEEDLGCALFVKDGRGLKLTAAGLRLREVAGDAFERLGSLCVELRQGAENAPFLLGCSGSLLARWFIPRLDRLNRELPDLRLHLSASDGELDPRRPGLNATLLFAEPPWPADMQVFELAGERIGPVLSPRYVRHDLLAAAAGLGVAIAPQQLVADDLAAGRLVAPWGFVETRAQLVLWMPARQVDRRGEQLAAWLRRELAG